MTDITRRDFMAASAAVTAGVTIAGAAQAAISTATPARAVVRIHADQSASVERRDGKRVIERLSVEHAHASSCAMTRKAAQGYTRDLATGLAQARGVDPQTITLQSLIQA